MKFGPKIILLIAILFSSALTFVIPFSAYLGYKFLAAIRIGIGLFQGVMFACINTLWIKWIPPNERGILIGFSNIGMKIGNVI